jgi:diguanylate cyclase (GGDEF)-like protein/PAS domain S-box-containing protein
MNLDIKTLMLLVLIIDLIGVVAIAIIWRQNRTRFAGMSLWLVNMIMQAAGSALIVLRGLVPDFFSIVISNTLLLGGIVSIQIGLERFTGKPGRHIHNFILLGIFIALSFYFSSVVPDLELREVIISGMIAIFTFQCAWLLLFRVEPRMRATARITGIVFAGYVAVNLTRLGLLVAFPLNTSDFFTSGAVDALALTMYIFLGACLTLGLILMVNERLLNEVQRYTGELEKKTDLLNDTGKLAKVGGWEFDVDTRLQTWTDQVYRIHELEMDHQPSVEEGIKYYAPQAAPVISAAVDRTIKSGEPFDLELPFITAKGNHRWVHAVGRAFRKDGKIVKVGGTFQDITESKLAQKKLEQMKHQYEQLLDSAGEGIIGLNADGMQIFVNKSAAQLLGYEPGELIGKNGHSVWHYKKPDGTLYPADECPIHKTLKQGEIFVQHNDLFWKKDGSSFPVEYTSTPIKENGEISGTVVTFSDISFRRQTEERLLELSTHDNLTGLANRILLFDRFNTAVAHAQRNNKKIAVLSLDLDKFKAINDTYGHAVGDELLVAVARRMTAVLRKSDTVSRIGGDEFVMLLTNLKQISGATTAAKKILDEFKRPFAIGIHDLSVTTSIGISIFPDDGGNLTELIKISDEAMYIAKDRGRKQFYIEENHLPD